MEQDQKETAFEQSAPVQDAQEEQADKAEDLSEEAEEEQDASESERLFANKYKSVEELEAAYDEIQRFVGGRKELEDKARAYDRLVVEQAKSANQTSVGLPKLGAYILEDGTIDIAKYDAHMEAYQAEMLNQVGSVASKTATEQSDMRKLEIELPYLKTDKVAARAVITAYKNGEANSIYEAGMLIDAERRTGLEQEQKIAQAKAQNELSKKSRGNTERGTSKETDTDEMTPEKFAKLSREQQRRYINQNFKESVEG